MTCHEITDLGEVTIALNAALSDEMDFSGWRGGANRITIYGPGTLTNAVKVQVSPVRSGDVWMDKEVKEGTTDVTIPADGAVTIEGVGFKRLRLKSAGNEAAERVFYVKGEVGA